MAIISQTYLITLRIDPSKASNFPNGFRDPEIYGDCGYNWNSYPNWDYNFFGHEADFIDAMLADFQQSFGYDGLSCLISRVRYDE